MEYTENMTARGATVITGRWETWTCAICHWYRDIPNERVPEQQTRIIDHPVYGLISGYSAATMDITRHSCKYTREARERHGIRVQRVRGPYVHTKAA